jgi:hypothetical protein
LINDFDTNDLSSKFQASIVTQKKRESAIEKDKRARVEETLDYLEVMNAIEKSLSRIEELNLYQCMANLYNFISYKEKEVKRSVLFEIVLIVNFFIQIVGLLCSLALLTPNNSAMEVLFVLFKVSRTSYDLSLVPMHNIGIAALAVYCLLDVYFLYSTFVLASSSTKVGRNIFKTRNQQIWYVQLYMETYKWLLFIPKIDLVIGAFACDGSYGW